MYLIWHLGMGDAIICNGMVRQLVEKWGTITLPVKPHNIKSVSFMFRDDDRIHFLLAQDDNEMLRHGIDRQHFKIGIHTGRPFDFQKWDQELYRTAGVEFRHRWDSFKFDRDALGEVKMTSKPISLIFDDYSRGMKIDEMKIPREYLTMRTENIGVIFQWYNIIQNCSRLDFMDGAMMCLADSIDLKEKPCFYHRYVRPSIPPTFKNKWQTIL